ncbi:MAG: prolyl oligopeptidase family serine peptidase, partial [Geobacteraceae bacterium]|nr:prolyl oligopeptidase family serine peptidase [Geobacteraceae bacterium]
SNARVVVWQEGGPGPAMLNHYYSWVENPYNLLANFGFAVLFVPLSGREGYGPAFYNALSDNNNFGKIDIDEMADIVKQMIAKGYAAPAGVGITGCSYGGYFTSQSITRHPDLYAAANTQCSLLDLFTEWQFGYTPRISYHLGMSPTTSSAEYIADSPLFNASKVKTPLLIFHGDGDFLPFRTAQNFHDQIEANGSAVNLIEFSYEGHGLSYANDEIIAAQAQIDWFNRFLVAPNS